MCATGPERPITMNSVCSFVVTSMRWLITIAPFQRIRKDYFPSLGNLLRRWEFFFKTEFSFNYDRVDRSLIQIDFACAYNHEREIMSLQKIAYALIITTGVVYASMPAPMTVIKTESLTNSSIRVFYWVHVLISA